jgi:hypothetical protein
MWMRAIKAASASTANRIRVLPSSLTSGNYKATKNSVLGEQAEDHQSR